jgi:hypothetical protein
LFGYLGFYNQGKGVYLLDSGYAFDPAHVDDAEIVANSIEYDSSNVVTESIEDGILVLRFPNDTLTVSNVTGNVRYIVCVRATGGALGCYIDLGQEVVLQGEANFDFYFPNGLLRIDMGTT